MKNESFNYIIGGASFQPGFLAFFVIALVILIALRWRWVLETYELGAEYARRALWTIRAIFFGYGAFAILAILLNVGELTSWERVQSILALHFSEPWMVKWTGVVSCIGLLVGLYAYAGGFTSDSDSENTVLRGRGLISLSAAQDRLDHARGRSISKRTPPSWWQQLLFQFYLARKSLLKQFSSQGQFIKATERANEIRSFNDEGILWGNLRLPCNSAVTHFAVVGSSGSGKGLNLRMLQQSVLPKLGASGTTAYGQRALVFNPKQDAHSILHGMPIKAPIITFDAFDQRTVAWDLSVDIDSPAAARQMAEILIPDEKNATQKYFPDGARALLAATMIALDEIAPGKWTFRDVLLALHSRSILEPLLKKSDEAWSIANLFFADDKTFPGVMSTVATKTTAFRVVAALWHDTTPKFSIKQWLNSESIVILGHHPAFKNSIEPINRAFLDRLTQMLLLQPETKAPKTWLFLDELQELGGVSSLPSLLTQGRSKGVCAALGFQAIEGLREVYGQNVPDLMVGQTANRTFLRNTSPVSCAWVQSIYGQYQAIESSYSEGISNSNQGTTTSYSKTYNQTVREAVMASEISSIPETSEVHGMTAYHDIGLIGAYKTHLTWAQLDEMLLEPDQSVPSSKPQDKEKQKLLPWSPTDLDRLGLDRSLLNVASREHNETDIFGIRRDET